MSKLKKHGYAERLKYMHMLEDGYSRNYIHCKFGIANQLLLRLWESYKQYGESALIKQKNVRAPLDMFNGEIISYSISSSPDLRMVFTMLNKAFRKVKDTDGMIMHSDQGWHYQHVRYQQMLKNHGIIQSMSRKGNCLDNSMMENFFGLMKTELLYLHEWSSVDEFEKELRSYINYYNNDRIKLRLKGKSPVQYRTLYQ